GGGRGGGRCGAVDAAVAVDLLDRHRGAVLDARGRVGIRAGQRQLDADGDQFLVRPSGGEAGGNGQSGQRERARRRRQELPAIHFHHLYLPVHVVFERIICSA